MGKSKPVYHDWENNKVGAPCTHHPGQPGEPAVPASVGESHKQQKGVLPSLPLSLFPLKAPDSPIPQQENLTASAPPKRKHPFLIVPQTPLLARDISLQQVPGLRSVIVPMFPGAKKPALEKISLTFQGASAERPAVLDGARQVNQTQITLRNLRKLNRYIRTPATRVLNLMFKQTSSLLTDVVK